MLTIKHIPTFDLKNVESFIQGVQVFEDEANSDGVTHFIFKVGEAEFPLTIPESFEDTNFEIVFSEVSGFALTKKNSAFILKATRIVSIEEVRQALTAVLSYFTSEGHGSTILRFVRYHDAVITGILSCVTECYFLNDGLVDLTNKVNEGIINAKGDRILPSIFAVVKV